MEKNNEEMNKIVLSYHDSLLRYSDLCILKGAFWINDAIIGFYFEFLSQKYAKAEKKFLFVSPELTQLLRMQDVADFDIFLKPIGASDSDFIFFPLNDNDSKDKPGGTHWSLLVYSKPENIYFHFDSNDNLNRLIANEFIRKMKQYLQSDDIFYGVDCPQQTNNSDCGLFVLCNTDIVCEHILTGFRVSDCDLTLTKKMVRLKRIDLLTLIDSLRNESTSV